MTYEPTFEIKEHIAVIAKHETGWTKELNRVSWNGNAPKWDIRDWSPDHTKMGRGITLYEAEMLAIVNAMLEWGNDHEDPEEDEEDEEPENEEPEGESPPSPDLSIKYDTGEMNINIVKFICNRNIPSIRELVNKVIKIAHNREEVLEASMYYAKKIITMHAGCVDKKSETESKRAARFLEFAAKIA